MCLFWQITTIRFTLLSTTPQVYTTRFFFAPFRLLYVFTLLLSLDVLVIYLFSHFSTSHKLFNLPLTSLRPLHLGTFPYFTSLGSLQTYFIFYSTPVSLTQIYVLCKTYTGSTYSCTSFRWLFTRSLRLSRIPNVVH